MSDLIVRELGTGKEVHRVNVDGKGPREIQKVMLGMLRNMSERYYVDDSEALPVRGDGGRERG